MLTTRFHTDSDSLAPTIQRLFLICSMGHLVLSSVSHADSPSLRTQVVLATYRLEHPKTSGSAFIIGRPDPSDSEGTNLLLVTAAHAFEKMDGDQATLVLRKKGENGDWAPMPTKIEIRKDNKPLFQKHPKQDIAVMSLKLPARLVSYLPLSVLANGDDWKASGLEPGSLIRCVGFPHASHFKPSKAGFPLTRLGCVAGFPLRPYTKQGRFLVDFNTFEGDSGGPVYYEPMGNHPAQVKVIGLVHGQHFIDEQYALIYQQGKIRKRLGLAIIVNSQAILETIESLP